jgi:hypothetical protein
MDNFLKNIKYIAFFVFTITVLLSACRKKEIIDNNPDLKLEFSNDSIIFDTVFTSLGSATKRLMIYNRSNSKILISSIVVEKGQSSPFRINIDGEPVYSAKDIELEGGDSLFVFARVTIDPNNTLNPFIVEDKIDFLTNGNEQSVKLVAWGQNAHYIVADSHTDGFPDYKIVADSLETVRWTSDLPYVIYGYAVIDSYGELIIDAGTKIYFHANSGLWSYSEGTLKVMGTLENPVTFGGDRLEPDYADLPGQWDRIWLMEGRPGFDHEFHNVIIKNGFIGIQAESFLKATENKVVLDNVIIENMNGMGLFTRFFAVEGKNVVIADCGGYCMALTGGGAYDFKHATLANYWSYSVRNTPALYINNYLIDTSDNQVPFNMNFFMGNSIIYGYNQNEFDVDMIGGADSTYLLDHCNLRSTLNFDNENNYKYIFKNEDPLFVNADSSNFRLDTLSPAIGKGDPDIASQVPLDIEGNSRLPLPDLGAYQRIPE